MAPRKIGALPPPPTSLDDRDLLIIGCREALFRIHRVDQDPAFSGKTGLNRFDAPAGEYGMLYAAIDHHAAFIEVFGDALERTVRSTFLSERGWARVEPSRELRLVDLSGPGLAQIGADERLCSGEHHVAQHWSLALWQHRASVDGLYYRARHDPSRMSVAVFDRAESAVTVLRDGGLLDSRNQAVLAAILESYQFALL